MYHRYPEPVIKRAARKAPQPPSLPPEFSVINVRRQTYVARSRMITPAMHHGFQMRGATPHDTGSRPAPATAWR